MIQNTINLRPRYGEVDQMGYVYHANYVSYCHQARTELMRNLGIHDQVLEENQIMIPVISINLRYLKAARYDELLTIRTTLREMPKTRCQFEFEIRNEANEKICTAVSEIVFVDSISRKPMRVPEIVKKVLSTYFKTETE
ncbi:MAG: thioesterase family protein [Bacteroidota bacterium]|nr:thioesterase family protein [Bacteroidota bacterium]